MRDRRSWKSARRQARYRAIEAENARDLEPTGPPDTSVVELPGDDHRDPREIARAANAALRGAVS